MREIKDIFIEEYWDVLYRQVSDSAQGIYEGNRKQFKRLDSGRRYWYADPFLFEKDGKLYLFVECIDNTTEKGSIAFSEFIDGVFTKPEIILKEGTHLSYPFVFETDGQVYMMPESHQKNCIRLYKAEIFPYRWIEDRIIVDNVNSVDTVRFGNWLITGEICPAGDKSVDMNLYRFDNGKPHTMNPIVKSSFLSRGAGAVFELAGRKVRPAQNCSESVYGRAVIFNEIIKADDDGYEEREIFRICPENISAEHKLKPLGVHTYGFLRGIEVVDVKLRRMNLARVLWIIRKKLFR